MTFVKERISDEDFEKYHIEKTGHGRRADNFRYWMIDRERDIYLRENWRDWQEPSNRYWWFYWKGYEGNVTSTTLSFVPEVGGGLSQQTMRVWISPSLKSAQQGNEIQNAFMEAYRADSFYSGASAAFEFV